MRSFHLAALWHSRVWKVCGLWWPNHLIFATTAEGGPQVSAVGSAVVSEILYSAYSIRSDCTQRPPFPIEIMIYSVVSHDEILFRTSDQQPPRSWRVVSSSGLWKASRVLEEKRGMVYHGGFHDTLVQARIGGSCYHDIAFSIWHPPSLSGLDFQVSTLGCSAKSLDTLKQSNIS